MRVIGYEVLHDVRDVVCEISGCELAKPRDLGAKSQVLNIACYLYHIVLIIKGLCLRHLASQVNVRYAANFNLVAAVRLLFVLKDTAASSSCTPPLHFTREARTENE